MTHPQPNQQPQQPQQPGQNPHWPQPQQAQPQAQQPGPKRSFDWGYAIQGGCAFLGLLIFFWLSNEMVFEYYAPHLLIILAIIGTGAYIGRKLN